MKAAFLLALAALLCCPALAEEPNTDTPAYRGLPTVGGGRCCQTLGEVRDNIDRLDGEIRPVSRDQDVLEQLGLLLSVLISYTKDCRKLRSMITR